MIFPYSGTDPTYAPEILTVDHSERSPVASSKDVVISRTLKVIARHVASSAILISSSVACAAVPDASALEREWTETSSVESTQDDALPLAELAQQVEAALDEVLSQLEHEGYPQGFLLEAAGRNIERAQSLSDEERANLWREYKFS